MKSIWDRLSGKKTAIGATLNAVFLWVVTQYPELVADNQATVTLVVTLLSIWTGLSIAHKGVKGELTGKKAP